MEETITADRHPDPDEWIAYHGGEVAASDEERLRGHLAGCPRCVSLVLDLETFAESPKEARAAVSEFEMAAAWRAMKTALDAKDRAERERRPPPPTAAEVVPLRPRRQHRAAGYLAMAASLAIGALGLTLWSSEHRQVDELRARVAALSEPRVNVAIHDLYSDTATRSGGEPEWTEVSYGSSLALVMLPTEAFASYEVEIVDAGRRLIWNGSGLIPDPEFGTLTLGLPPGYLEPGEYRVLLYGDQRSPLQDDLPIRVLP